MDPFVSDKTAVDSSIELPPLPKREPQLARPSQNRDLDELPVMARKSLGDPDIPQVVQMAVPDILGGPTNKVAKAARYGMTVPGSKNKIASWIMDQLPSGDTFVDLMSGGGAITDAASRSGKFKKVISVELDPEKLEAQRQMFYGKLPTFDEFVRPNTIDEFKQLPPIHKNVLSFGGNFRDKVPGITDEEIARRLSRLQEVNSFKETRAPIEFVNSDYKNFKIPNGDVIMYTDPPYRGTTGYKFKFDPDDFDRWLLDNAPRRTYVSEYTLPESYYDILGSVPKQNTLGKTTNVTELLGRIKK